MKTPGRELEEQFIEKLRGLKQEYRPDSRDLVPLLKKRAQGREISGLSAYEK